MYKVSLKILVTVSMAILSCFYTQATLTAEKENLPNVIIILTDDLGYGDLGSYGGRIIKTPHLDQMANEGMRLTNAYSSSSNCSPSRAGLLTGRYAIRSGMAHQVIFESDTHGLPQSEWTIAEMLKQLNYKTAIVGKWHLGHTPEYWPTKQGFDYYYGLPYSNNQSPLALYRNENKIEEPVDQKTLTRNYTRETIRFIEKNQNEPFFVYLAHTFPHVPLHVSDKFKGKSKAALYGDVVEELDWSTGEILSSLKRLGLDKKTLVIFSSDNGPYQGGVTGGLRGSKGTPWEGGYRVPFLARWPGKIPANSVSEAISMNIDLLPTIQKITGASLPDSVLLDGKDIMPVLQGSQHSPHEKLYIFADEKIAGIRTQNWKAVFLARYRGINRWLPKHDVRLLFNMLKDPFEQYSVVTSHEDIWQQMTTYLQEGVDELESLALHLK